MAGAVPVLRSNRVCGGAWDSSRPKNIRRPPSHCSALKKTKIYIHEKKFYEIYLSKSISLIFSNSPILGLFREYTQNVMLNSIGPHKCLRCRNVVVDAAQLQIHFQQDIIQNHNCSLATDSFLHDLWRNMLCKDTLKNRDVFLINKRAHQIPPPSVCTHCAHPRDVLAACRLRKPWRSGTDV